MERLEAKQIHGQTYYYYSKWAWVDGKCRRVWQKYLGKLEDIAKAVGGNGPVPMHAEVFQWGLPTALWKEAMRARVAEESSQLCPKREQGFSTGEYLAIAAINRAISPVSKRSIWEWFSQTALLRYYPQASPAVMASQRFWDHMERIQGETSLAIWKNILRGALQREAIDLSAISYDGTNFYTFIDTFNIRCHLARRGKNKQGRGNLRQVSYALFCSADGHIPLFYDVYEGNRNDTKQFPLMLQRFADFFRDLHPDSQNRPQTTLVFDKGNNSKENFALIDSLQLSYVGSVKLDEHPDLVEISNSSPTFQACRAVGLMGTKTFRVKQQVYGQERILVVSYNQNLFQSQWLTLQNDIAKAVETLAGLHQKLEDRAQGLVKGGQAPTLESVQGQCASALQRQHLKQIITLAVQVGPQGLPQLQYAIDTVALNKLADTYLGKNILVTDRQNWDDEKIVQAYRSQYVIENVFKEMKDRRIGSWWPLHHWTDSKIRVHGLYCTIALLLRALLLRRIQRAGIKMSMKRAFAELDNLREIVNIYPRKRGQKQVRQQTVLSKASELQQQLIGALQLRDADNGLLG